MMNVIFWTLAGLMIALALGFVALPLWRHGRPGGNLSSEHVDVALYRQRRAEIDRELDAGLLTDEAHRLALAELDRQLLTDTEGGDRRAGPNGRSPSRRWPLAVVAVALPLIAVAFYLEVGGGSQALTGEARQFDPHDIDAMVRRLEERLEKDPDDGEGWLILGRSYAVMDRSEEAVRALSRAQRLLGDTPEVLLEYAQALASSRERTSFAGRPAELVDRALEQAPDHPRALWLSGVSAVERGDYAVAVARWERLLPQLATDSEDARVVRRNLEAVRTRLDPQATNGAPAARTAAPDDEAPEADASLRVSVALARELEDRVDAGDPVFIFARAVGGPPMPLAVAKRWVRDLPVTVTLDDGDSMMLGNGISRHETVEVVARVSKSGDAAARPGDLESAARTVPVNGSDTISLTVDAVVQ